MNKKTVGGVASVALLAIAYGGGTWYAGTTVRSNYESALRAFESRVGNLRIVDRSYERDFFGAVSTFTLEIGCKPELAEPGMPIPRLPRITVRDTLHHGPLASGTLAAATIDTEFFLGPEEQAEAAKIFGSAKPLTMHTKVAFDGTFSRDIAVAPIKFSDAMKGELHWQGMRAHLVTNTAHHRMAFDLTMPGLEASLPADGFRLKLGKLSATADLDMSAGRYLPTGPAVGRLESLAFTAADSEEAKDHAFKPVPNALLQNLDLKADAGITDGMLATKATLSGKGKIGDTTVDHFVVSGGFSRFHAATYRKITDAWSNSDQTAACAIGIMNKLEGLEALGQQILPDLKTMAQYGPALGLDQLVVEIGGKRAEFAYTASLVGVTEDDLKTPVETLLIKRGVLKASGRLPATWLERLAEVGLNSGVTPPPEMVGGLLEQAVERGYVKRDGDDIFTRIEFSTGVLKVNDQPADALGKSTDATSP